MNLIQKVKAKLVSKRSFKKNELAEMGPGKIPKKAPAKKAPAKKVKKNGK